MPESILKYTENKPRNLADKHRLRLRHVTASARSSYHFVSGIDLLFHLNFFVFLVLILNSNTV
jgi:hypothetical protein